jgi:hypothetical protein
MSDLFEYQKVAADQLKTGSILCGGVGSGKTLTSVYYYFLNESPKDLYVITTAQKRDTLDWERECANFSISRIREDSVNGASLTVDSWNNIKKYVDVENAFFIFDEQRVIGSGSWTKSFYKIAKKNNWILLSATPGDTWLDYIPVFIANGFYKNRTEFIREHVIFNNFTKFPKIDHYIGEGKLIKLKKKITVPMAYKNSTLQIHKTLLAKYNEELFNLVMVQRWNPYLNQPVKEISEYCFLLRKVVNSDPSRLKIVLDLLEKNRRLIIFYNFNYELDILRRLKDTVEIAEHNGHKHEGVPKTESWVYLVQYTSGSEGWNCIETNTLVFYSQNYSYRTMTQAAGRIDRLNTPFSTLYYYHIRSASKIDNAIMKALSNKKNFNESKFFKGEK